MSSTRFAALVALSLFLGASLGCGAVELGRSTPVPGPETVVAAATQTQQARATSTRLPPTVAPTTTAIGVVPSATAFVPANTTQAPATAQSTPAGHVSQPTATTAAPAGQPLPRLSAGQPLTITTINMVSEADGWAIAQSGADVHDHLLVTVDGTNSWVDVSPPEPAGQFPSGKAAVGYFRDATNAWVAYYDRQAAQAPGDALVWHTSDGGNTWAASKLLDVSGVEYYAPSDFAFADEATGWLLAHVGVGMSHDYVMLYATRDRGASWQRVVDPYLNNLAQSCSKTGLGLLNTRTGWVTGDCHAVAPGVYFQRTDDGGATWQEQVLPPPQDAADLFTRDTVGCGTYSLQLLPPDAVRVAVVCVRFEESITDYLLYASDDAGQSWRISRLPGRAIQFLTPQVGWAQQDADPNQPGATREVHHTEDGGQTWTRISTVSWSGQLDFVSPEIGWGVARAGDAVALVNSRDGGRNWRLLQPRTGR